MTCETPRRIKDNGKIVPCGEAGTEFQVSIGGYGLGVRQVLCRKHALRAVNQGYSLDPDPRGFERDTRARAPHYARRMPQMQLKRGDVMEVRVGKEIRIFTACGDPHSGNTLIDAVDTDGKRGGVYLRDVISRIGGSDDR